MAWPGRVCHRVLGHIKTSSESGEGNEIDEGGDQDPMDDMVHRKSLGPLTEHDYSIRWLLVTKMASAIVMKLKSRTSWHDSSQAGRQIFLLGLNLTGSTVHWLQSTSMFNESACVLVRRVPDWSPTVHRSQVLPIQTDEIWIEKNIHLIRFAGFLVSFFLSHATLLLRTLVTGGVLILMTAAPIQAATTYVSDLIANIEWHNNKLNITLLKHCYSRWVDVTVSRHKRKIVEHIALAGHISQSLAFGITILSFFFRKAWLYVIISDDFYGG